MSTHTPGPWIIDPRLNGKFKIKDRGGFERIAICEAPNNARLIAAAPEMLAALQQAISSRWLSIDFEHNRTKEACDIRAAICAAIAKAEGVS